MDSIATKLRGAVTANTAEVVVRTRSRRSSYIVLDADKVRAAMDRRCLNATQVAKRAGVSAPVVSRILHGNPVQRHKAAQVIRAILTIPEVEGIGDFLHD